MMNLRFPSDDAPGLPEIEISVPDSWQPVVVPPALLAARARAPSGAFATNVVVSVERRAGSLRLSEAADSLRSALMQEPEAELIGSISVELSGRDGVALEVAFRDPEAGTVVQTHRLLLVESGGASDLIHVVGTCAGDVIDQELVGLRASVDSVTASQ